MALTDEGNGMVMPVSPMYGGNNGMGFGGDWASWIILFLIFGLFGGNWGNGFGGGMWGGEGLYPWMNQSNQISQGFENAALGNQIDGIQNGIQGINTQLCNGFAGVNQTVNSGFANAETAANARQIANMQQAFGAQTAMAQGFNQIESRFADCCCENRLANCQTQNLVQNEGNATRFADANNTSAIMNAINSGVQSIKDQLCQDKIDEKNDTIAQLRQEVLYSRGQASQDVQTARLLAGQTSEVDALYNRLAQCPVPCMPVYGMTPIFTCNNGNNGGCGCGNNF